MAKAKTAGFVLFGLVLGVLAAGAIGDLRAQTQAPEPTVVCIGISTIPNLPTWMHSQMGSDRQDFIVVENKICSWKKSR